MPPLTFVNCRFLQRVRISRSADRCNIHELSLSQSVRLSVTFQFLVQTIRSRGLQYQVSSMFDELRPETAECCWLILACIYNCSYNYNYCNGRSDCLSVCPSVRHVPVFSVAHPKGIKGCIPTGGRLEWHSLSYEMRSCAFCMLVTSFCGPPGKLHVLFTKGCMSWMMEHVYDGGSMGDCYILPRGDSDEA